jgi:DUF4097 and DUF4098 domain-containing protein YvlB
MQYIILFLLAAIIMFVSLIVPAQAQETRENFNQTYQLNSNGQIRVSNINGDINVEAWEKNEVKVEAVKVIEGCDRSPVLEIKVDSKPDFLQIKTDYGQEDKKSWNWGGNRCRKLYVDYKLTVPRTARLDGVETVNGGIDVTGMTDFVRASTVNGEINAKKLSGSIAISAVNGKITAGFDEIRKGTTIKMSTVNGIINLSLPSDVDATVKIGTVNGSISNDFGLPVKVGEYVGRNVHAKLGNGEIPVNLSDVNGTISIKRNSDGRTVKPVTNLLPVKSNSDEPDVEDPDIDVDVEPGQVNVPKINRDIAKANQDAKRQVERLRQEQMRARIEMERNKRQAERDLERTKREAERNAWMINNLSWSNYPFGVREEKSFTVKGVPEVTIEARDCIIRVRGWDKSEVAYSFIKAGNSTTAKVETKNNGSDVELKVTGECDENRLEVFVPRKTKLKVSSNAEIRVEGVSGKLDLSNEDGAIDVRDSDGELNAQVADGRVRVIGFNGAVSVTSGDGDIFLEGNFNRLSTNTGDGTTVLTLPENADATIKANTEDITLTGITATKQADSKSWKIGNGGKDFSLNTADGKILIRRANTVTVSR